MYSTIYLGRQPIVDAQQKRVAYELLFRSGPENRALFQDDVNATASVIRHAFIDLGLSRVLEGCPGFVNVSEKLLFSPVLDLLPPDTIILEILESVELTPSVYERCAQLKARGYQLALDDVCDITPDMQQLLLEAVPGRPLLSEALKAQIDGRAPGAQSPSLREMVDACARTAAT